MARKRRKAEAGAIACRPVELPADMLVEAAKVATRINLVNAPRVDGLPDDLLPEPAQLALLTQQKWQAGQTITWAFIDGADAEVRRQMAAAFARWAKYVKLEFAETSPAEAVCRIARTPTEGHYSYLGTGNLLIRPPQKTMNLAGFTARTPQAEWQRVADHEIGHLLGFAHEHLTPDIVAMIDPAKAIAYFGGPPNYWPEQLTRLNVLTPLRPGEAQVFSARPDSVMCYALPGAIMKNGVGIEGGAGITPEDGRDAANAYPGRLDPVPPPPPGIRRRLSPGDAPIVDAISRPGERDQYELEVIRAGRYAIVTRPAQAVELYLPAAAPAGRLAPMARADNGRLTVDLEAKAYLVEVMNKYTIRTGGYQVSIRPVRA